MVIFLVTILCLNRNENKEFVQFEWERSLGDTWSKEYENHGYTDREKGTSPVSSLQRKSLESDY